MTPPHRQRSALGARERGRFLVDGGGEDVEVGDDVGVGEQPVAEGVGDRDDGDTQGVAGASSTSECMLRTGAPSTLTGWRGPGTFETLRAKVRGLTCSRWTQRRRPGAARLRRVNNSSSSWASWWVLRRAVAAWIARSRLRGSGSPTGSGRQK